MPRNPNNPRPRRVPVATEGQPASITSTGSVANETAAQHRGAGIDFIARANQLAGFVIGTNGGTLPKSAEDLQRGLVAGMKALGGWQK